MKAATLSVAAVLVAALGLACNAAAAERGRATLADRTVELAQQMPQLQPALPPSLTPRAGRRGLSRSPVDPLAPPPIPADPMAKQDEAIRRALQDPALRAGLPPNAPIAPPSNAAPPATGLPTQADRLDRDRDGRITRDEYFRGRERVPPAGLTTDTRQRILQQRLDTQFKQLDQNHDGAITPDELQANPNSRF
jgi:hypothetical protein